jgi:hypothetical protein
MLDFFFGGGGLIEPSSPWGSLLFWGLKRMDPHEIVLITEN